MKASELHTHFIDELKGLLPEWKFIKNERHFKKNEGAAIWYLHISCINHATDFDAVGSVALEFKNGKDQLCIIGAELGNIAGTGQHRFPISNLTECKSSSTAFYDYFLIHGLPFLHKFSNPSQVVTTLSSGGKEALLISPLINQHQTQISQLSQYYDVSM